jgi:hypothetical protein
MKEMLRTNNEYLKKLKFTLSIDGKEIDLSSDFLTEDTVRIDFEYGYLLLLPKHGSNIFPAEFNYGTSNISFVNSALCSGMHEKIIDEWLGTMFDYKYAYKHVNKLFVMDLPPKYVSFGDQNKTRFATGRWTIEPLLDRHLKRKMWNGFNKRKSQLWRDINKEIEEKIFDNEMSLVKKEKKKKKASTRITEKYFAPSSTKDTLFIVEGNCVAADTKINVWRNNKKKTIKISDVELDDYVITHNHRFKEITNIQRKLKDLINVKTTFTNYICGKDHPFYVFNKVTNKFSFTKARNLDFKNERIVRSTLGEFVGTEIVIRAKEINEGKYKIELTLSNGDIWKNTKEHKYCIIKDGVFKMIPACDISELDEIAKFQKYKK